MLLPHQLSTLVSSIIDKQSTNNIIRLIYLFIYLSIYQ